MRRIVETPLGVTLIGGAPTTAATLSRALSQAPILVAADGGADRALAHGLMPEAVIGDIDSLDPASRARIGAHRIHRIVEQDSTDFDKCLRSIAAPFVIAAGFSGGRTDHHLAALNGLVRRPVPPCILLDENDLCLNLPARLVLDLPAGTRLSLFPMAPVGGRSRGLAWPIDGIDFAPWARIGTSNAATGGEVVLEIDAPGMLLILPAGHLPAAIAALRAAAAAGG
jgi:thiamine pyrophosphokinase